MQSRPVGIARGPTTVQRAGGHPWPRPPHAMNPSLWPHQSAVWGSPRSKWCGPRHDACHGLHLAASQALAISPGRGAPTSVSRNSIARTSDARRQPHRCLRGHAPTTAVSAWPRTVRGTPGCSRSVGRPNLSVGSSRPRVSARRYSGRRSDTVYSSFASNRMRVAFEPKSQSRSTVTPPLQRIPRADPRDQILGRAGRTEMKPGRE